LAHVRASQIAMQPAATTAMAVVVPVGGWHGLKKGPHGRCYHDGGDYPFHLPGQLI
jgi:hypothetical protein